MIRITQNDKEVVACVALHLRYDATGDRRIGPRSPRNSFNIQEVSCDT